MPSQDAARLLVWAEAGLCNKLRVLLSYREVAVERGRALLVVWRLGKCCDATFGSLFRPLSSVSFLHSHRSSRLTGLGVRAAALDETPWLDVPPPEVDAIPADLSILKPAYDAHPSVKYTERETEMYLALRPLPKLERAIASRVLECGPRYVAVHVRRTDHAACFGERTSDADFFRFVDAFPDHALFVATDNAATQQVFAARYGERVRAMRPISPAWGSAEPPGADARHTALSDAVVDLYTCVDAAHFKGTPLSSFSDTIAHIRRARGRASSGDEHVARSLGGKFYDQTDFSLEVSRPRAEAQARRSSPRLRDRARGAPTAHAAAGGAHGHRDPRSGPTGRRVAARERGGRRPEPRRGTGGGGGDDTVIDTK